MSCQFFCCNIFYGSKEVNKLPFAIVSCLIGWVYVFVFCQGFFSLFGARKLSKTHEMLSQSGSPIHA